MRRSALLSIVKPEKRTHAILDMNRVEKRAYRTHRTDDWAF
jgi:hypothetical protein